MHSCGFLPAYSPVCRHPLSLLTSLCSQRPLCLRSLQSLPGWLPAPPPLALGSGISLQPPGVPWLQVRCNLCNSCKSVLTCSWRGADSYSLKKNCLLYAWCLVPSRNAVKVCELEGITVLTNRCVRALCAQMHDTFLLSKAFVLKPKRCIVRVSCQTCSPFLMCWLEGCCRPGLDQDCLR